MFIQGNLQLVFDALYTMGVINPALKADWSSADRKVKQTPGRLQEAIQVVNRNSGSMQNIIAGLQKFDQETLLFLAMEVAREFVDFEDRKVLH